MSTMLRLSPAELKAHMDRLAKLPVRKVEKLKAQAPVKGGKEAVRDKAAFLKTTEHGEQKAVISWWALAHKSYGLPEYALYAVPNGSNKSIQQAMKFKREGLRKGIPDLNLDAPRGEHSGLRLEMKVKPNKPSAEQDAVLEYMVSAGYVVGVCYSAAEAIGVIKDYLGGGENGQ